MRTEPCYTEGTGVTSLLSVPTRPCGRLLATVCKDPGVEKLLSGSMKAQRFHVAVAPVSSVGDRGMKSDRGRTAGWTSEAQSCLLREGCPAGPAPPARGPPLPDRRPAPPERRPAPSSERPRPCPAPAERASPPGLLEAIMATTPSLPVPPGGQGPYTYAAILAAC